MNSDNIKISTRPLLKTRKFSTLHIEIFEQVICSGKSNRTLNKRFGYTLRSHKVVDHSKTVMLKLLAFEGLCKKDYMDRVIRPRANSFWWKNLFDKHRKVLMSNAVNPEFYSII
ncbi:MAG: hypothetical protein EOP45_03620 [Sphingobacteriaceae bacterium]|nr:MAG: hypothetical protein EOP45_03620 [Sphingobacteriaceae bacterium]